MMVQVVMQVMRSNGEWQVKLCWLTTHCSPPAVKPSWAPLFYGMKPRLTEKRQLIQNHIITESRVKISLPVFFLLKRDFFLCYTVKSQMTNHLSFPVSPSPLPPFFLPGFLPALTPLPFVPPSPFNTHFSKKEVQVTD